MKKFFILSILAFLHVSLNAQLSGDGSYGSPWSGTLSGDATWSGTNFVNGDITIDNEKLTISQGSIIIFLAETADIIVTGTGQLEADGTSGSRIRFTSDDDNDGNYGESGERWGHISFQSMGSAGASLIDNCIIEYGDVSSTSLLPANPSQYGGGIHTDFSNLTISNTDIRYCRAGWGGGIFVGNGENPAISNCRIHNNTSSTAGGGMYLWTDSYSTISNCIISFNNSTGTGGAGGIFLGGMAKNVTFINCVISSNTANNQSIGYNIRFNNNTNTPKPKFVNSIVWYPANSIVYQSGGTALAADFEYCAIQTPPITYTHCITLNATNNNPAGPNFAATDGSDWSVYFISPCRDAGTTPTPAVPYDFAGNSRIGSYDMGAYEVQYSRWRTTAASNDWNSAGNWEPGVPTGTSDVVIPAGASNYPVTEPGPDFTIGSGKQMIIESGARATIDDLTNNGTLKLNHNASGFASLILGSYTRGTGGTEEIQLYLSGGGSSDNYKWHYISSPVSSISTDVFTGVTLDIAQFVESRPVYSLMQGWVGFDGYDYILREVVDGNPTFDELTPGKGYNYWDGANNTFTFGGSFNTSDINMPLAYSGIPSRRGFNLLGNPFSSGFFWDDIADSEYFTYPANTSKGVYFTRDDDQCTYIAGVGIPGDVTGYIPPMQGFFVKTYTTGNSITLAAAARTHSNIHSRYKGSAIIPLVRLALFEDSISSDETVVRFDEDAKPDLDNDFDAVKMFLSETKTTIHTSLNGEEYSVNGQPFPETELEIPVVVNMTRDTIHKISATQLQGLDNYDVLLIDNSTGYVADLKATPDVAFSSPAGLISDRFILKFTSVLTGMKDINAGRNSFNIYSRNGFINIVPINDEWSGKIASVRLTDITGKTTGYNKNIEFQKNVPAQIKSPAAGGIYIVEIGSGISKYTGKVVIR